MSIRVSYQCPDGAALRGLERYSQPRDYYQNIVSLTACDSWRQIRVSATVVCCLLLGRKVADSKNFLCIYIYIYIYMHVCCRQMRVFHWLNEMLIMPTAVVFSNRSDLWQEFDDITSYYKMFPFTAIHAYSFESTIEQQKQQQHNNNNNHNNGIPVTYRTSLLSIPSQTLVWIKSNSLRMEQLNCLLTGSANNKLAYLPSAIPANRTELHGGRLFIRVRRQAWTIIEQTQRACFFLSTSLNLSPTCYIVHIFWTCSLNSFFNHSSMPISNRF